MDKHLLQIIVISSILPVPTTAGSIVLYRHLIKLSNNWENLVICDPWQSDQPNYLMRVLFRCDKTRLYRFINDLRIVFADHFWKKYLRLLSIQSSQTIVLTVAHGDGYLAAQKFAKKNNLPLVTFFHDWWPDMLDVHGIFRRNLEYQIKQLYKASDLVLCVSEKMQEVLGIHANSVILYPIPEIINNNLIDDGLITRNGISSLKILYCGELYSYALMLSTLLQVIKNHPILDLQVRGANPNWPDHFKAEMRERKMWLDFAPREELNEWFASADVFLVAMNFDIALQKRMETSFPSKLPEYAQFGKPLIIWGPKYCSAVKWGQKGDRALCVTDNNPLTLVSALEELYNSPAKLQHYAGQARIAAQTEFNPHIIQDQFIKKINELLN